LVAYRPDYSAIESKLRKLKKKDRVQFEAVRKKMDQILENPDVYKPLGNILKGRFRVHIGSFVLLFVIHEEEKIVEFVDYDHHDKIYRKR
jgi:mRNA interferase RelE/StbE